MEIKRKEVLGKSTYYQQSKNIYHRLAKYFELFLENVPPGKISIPPPMERGRGGSAHPPTHPFTSTDKPKSNTKARMSTQKASKTLRSSKFIIIFDFNNLFIHVKDVILDDLINCSFIFFCNFFVRHVVCGTAHTCEVVQSSIIVLNIEVQPFTKLF